MHHLYHFDFMLLMIRITDTRIVPLHLGPSVLLRLPLPQAQALHHKMRNADNSAVFLLPKLQSMKENKPDLALLNIGASSGTITTTLAKLIPDS